MTGFSEVGKLVDSDGDSVIAVGLSVGDLMGAVIVGICVCLSGFEVGAKV